MGTKKRMTATLPATVCSEALAQKVQQYAEKTGKSKAEVVREAVVFFLGDERRNSTQETENRL